MPKPDAAADLAARMVQTLERLREQGDAYPPSLRHLRNPLANYAIRLAAGTRRQGAEEEAVRRSPSRREQAHRQSRRLGRGRRTSRRQSRSDELPCPCCVRRKSDFTPFPVDYQGGQGAETGVRRRPATPAGREVVAGGGWRRGGSRQAAALSAGAAAAGRGIVAETDAHAGNATVGGRKRLSALVEGVDNANRPAAGPALVKEAMRLPPFAGRTLSAAPRDPDAPMALTEDRDILLAAPPCWNTPSPPSQAGSSGRAADRSQEENGEAVASGVRGGGGCSHRGAAVAARRRLSVRQEEAASVFVADLVPASGGRQPPDGSESPICRFIRGLTPPARRASFAPPSTPRSTGWTAKRDRTISSICWTYGGPCRPITPRSTPACSSSSGGAIHLQHRRGPSRRHAGRAASRDYRGGGVAAVRVSVAADDSRSCKSLISAANRPARRFGLHSRQSGVGDILYGQRFALFAPRRQT